MEQERPKKNDAFNEWFKDYKNKIHRRGGTRNLREAFNAGAASTDAVKCVLSEWDYQHKAELNALARRHAEEIRALNAKLDICRRYALGEIHDPVDLAVDYGGTGFELDPACVAVGNAMAKRVPDA